MGMVVRSNIMAINANRQLGMNNSQVSKSLEKLSSGYKINRAGDDASGLAISEKMKAQIKGLETASANSQDGISLVQTAEGALTEVHDMLNRMVELAGKAANGTIDTATDRASLQKEMNALLDEIDRIAKSTNFNGIKLLDGSLGGGTTEVAAAVAGTPTAAGGETTTLGELTFAEGVDDAAKTALNEALIANGLSLTLSTGTGAGDTIADTTVGDYTVKVLDDADSATTTTADVAKLSFQDADGNVIATMTAEITGADTDGQITVAFTEAPAATGGTFTAASDTALSDAGITSIDLSGAAAEDVGDLAVAYDATGDELTVTIGGATYKGSYNAAAPQTVTLTKEGSTETIDVVIGDNTKFNADVDATTLGTVAAANKGLTLQIGDTADDFNQVTVSVKDMSTVGLGINALKIEDLTATTGGIMSQESAQNALDMIKTGANSAINLVSAARADLGALQNRLEHTINNLDVATENMESANSRIRDTDMAKEMMEYTKQSVLTQAAQAMLAQANQQPQSVLQLLQ